MEFEIKWKPSKSERQLVFELCLGIVVTKEYERILIGKRDDIRLRLEGAESAGILFDQIRPFGSFLLMLDNDTEGKWNTALTYLREAREILDESYFDRVITKEEPKKYEKEAMEILTEKYESDDLVSRFVAMRIWYYYWSIRGTKKEDDLNAFLSEAQVLIRPFNIPGVLLEERVSLTPEHPIFRYSKEYSLSDRIASIYTSLGEDNLACIIVDKSLLPIKKYYADLIRNWKKVVMKCERCGRFFIADNRSCMYCSDECRESARKRTLVKRREIGNTAEIDNLCITANAYWNNRRAKIRKSQEWSADEVRAYENAMKYFQKEKRNKRREYKEGKITLSELRNWLAEQSIEAEKAIDAIKVLQR